MPEYRHQTSVCGDKTCLDTFENDKLWIREFYANDVLEGPRTVYYSLIGQPRLVESYRNGKREGEKKTWYANGQLQELEFYRDGKPEGKFQSWNDDGSDCGETFYKNGKLDGVSKCRYANGRLLSLTHYQDGKEIKYITWNIKGYPSYISYKYDEGYEKEISWHFDGRRYRSSFRRFNKLNGEYKGWGNIEVHEYHRDDELICSDFATKSTIFRKLKIKLYIRVKSAVLSSFLIPDLTMSVISMIRI